MNNSLTNPVGFGKRSLAIFVAVATILWLSQVAFVLPAQGQTLEEQIASLLAQIAALQAQLDDVQGTPSGTTYNFTTNLKVGSTGADVTALQEFLKGQGSSIYPEGLVTGYFGPLTKAAVTKFQNAHVAAILTPVGLTAGTGYFGSSNSYQWSLCLVVFFIPHKSIYSNRLPTFWASIYYWYGNGCFILHYRWMNNIS